MAPTSRCACLLKMPQQGASRQLYRELREREKGRAIIYGKIQPQSRRGHQCTKVSMAEQETCMKQTGAGVNRTGTGKPGKLGIGEAAGKIHRTDNQCHHVLTPDRSRGYIHDS